MYHHHCHQVPGALWVVVIMLLGCVCLVLVALTLDIGRDLLGGHRHVWGNWKPKWGKVGGTHSSYWYRQCKTCENPSRSRWRS